MPSEEEVDHDTSDVVQRETSRRLWWSLVCQDAYTSSASGFSYSINLQHATTGVPTNVDDEDIVNGQPLVAHPSETLTSATMHIYKIGFALGKATLSVCTDAQWCDSSSTPSTTRILHHRTM